MLHHATVVDAQLTRRHDVPLQKRPNRRIAQVDEKRCVSELRSLLPPEVFDGLAREQFRPLRNALYELYRRWLED
jgi:hypothetical protein